MSELRRKIEHAIERPSLATIVHAGSERVTADTFVVAGFDRSDPRDRETFGEAFDTIEEGSRSWTTFVHVRENMLLAASVTTVPTETTPDLSEAWMDPFRFATSPSVPPPASRLLLRALRATPAILALAEARQRARPLAPWMANELATKWADGQRAALAFLASVPWAHVPTELVALADRLDLVALDRAMALYREHSRERFEKARAAGYPLHRRVPGSD